MSFDAFGGTVEEFTLHSIGYWLQQNPDKSAEKDHIKLKERYGRAIAAQGE